MKPPNRRITAVVALLVVGFVVAFVVQSTLSFGLMTVWITVVLLYLIVSDWLEGRSKPK